MMMIGIGMPISQRRMERMKFPEKVWKVQRRRREYVPKAIVIEAEPAVAAGTRMAAIPARTRAALPHPARLEPHASLAMA